MKLDQTVTSTDSNTYVARGTIYVREIVFSMETYEFTKFHYN